MKYKEGTFSDAAWLVRGRMDFKPRQGNLSPSFQPLGSTWILSLISAIYYVFGQTF